MTNRSLSEELGETNPGLALSKGVPLCLGYLQILQMIAMF